MAKTVSHITRGIQGTLGDLTFVKSKRYGKHVRSKRGTIKPVSLNNSLEENTAELTSAVLPAKLVFNAIRDEHKDGTLWTRLLNIYRKKLKVGSTPDLLCIKDLECSKEFR